MSILTKDLFAGAKWSWTETPADYPAPEFSLKAILKHSMDNPVIIDGVVQSDGSFLFTKPSSETSQLSHGNYSFQIIATDSNDEVYQVSTGVICILPLLSNSGDTRTYWQQILDNYRDAFKRLSERETESVTIDGDIVTFADRGKLIRMIRYAEREVARENGTLDSGIIKARYV